MTAAWPSGCKKPNSCERHRDIAPEIIEATAAILLARKKADIALKRKLAAKSRPSRVLSPEVLAARREVRELARLVRMQTYMDSENGPVSGGAFDRDSVQWRDVRLALERKLIVRISPGLYVLARA